MSGVEAAIASLFGAVLLPVGAAIIDPVVLFPVMITCLVFKSWASYLVAPIIGVVAYAMAHNIFASDGFVSVMRFGWLFAAASASVAIAFILRTVFHRYFAGAA